MSYDFGQDGGNIFAEMSKTQKIGLGLSIVFVGLALTAIFVLNKSTFAERYDGSGVVNGAEVLNYVKLGSGSFIPSTLTFAKYSVLPENMTDPKMLKLRVQINATNTEETAGIYVKPLPGMRFKSFIATNCQFYQEGLHGQYVIPYGRMERDYGMNLHPVNVYLHGDGNIFIEPTMVGRQYILANKQLYCSLIGEVELE